TRFSRDWSSDVCSSDLNKHIRFTGSKQAETELLLFFCEKMKKSGIRMDNSVQLSNLYFQQLRKIEKAIEAQHEDLQYDYRKKLEIGRASCRERVEVTRE